MKIIKSQILIALFIVLCQKVHAQGFVNLNFEEATIVPDTSSPYPNAVYAGDAIPGWIATGFIGPTDILYNSASLGDPSVSILGINGTPPALDGAFSIYLYGGGGPSTGASISQTAIVPSSTESLLFEAQQSGTGTLQVSLGGQNISFFALSTGANYTLYGGNVSLAFANQSEQLTFSALAGNNNFWNIDDIQFLPTAVPEPSVLGLSVLGSLLLALRRWKSAGNLAAYVRLSGVSGARLSGAGLCCLALRSSTCSRNVGCKAGGDARRFL
jgi:hypothetical protein